MKRKILGRLFLFLLLIVTLSAATAQAGEKTYAISYGRLTDSGYKHIYSKWDTTAKKGDVIKTPVLPDRDGRRCFWKAECNGKQIEIECGEKYTVLGTTKFSAFWRKICTVRYFTTSGVKEYTNDRTDLPWGENFITPSISSTSSHIFLGWSDKKNSKTAPLKAKNKYTLRQNQRLYAVWQERPKGTIRFYSQGGAKEYTGEKISTHIGEIYTLPRLKDSSTYRFLGWSETRNSLTAGLLPGKKYTMTASKKLYAVYIKKADPYATFVLASGTVYKVCMVDGRTVKFPSISYRDNRTNQGWSTKPGTTCNPQYKENDIIPCRTATYYTVDGNNNGGKDDGKTVVESKKYLHTYFVGDSRIYLGEYYLSGEFKKTRLIDKSGSGYDWLVSTGYNKLIQKIKADNAVKNGRKAVVFCSGINDMTKVNSYISFYKSKASQLRNLGCDLYVMSLNPFNRSQHIYMQRTYNGNPSYYETRTQDQLKTFNKRLKTGLAGIYKYIDTNTYLTRTGWSTYNIFHHVPDGLHYSKPVTRKVFSYAAAFLDK